MKKITAIIVLAAILGLTGCSSAENTNENTTAVTEKASASETADASNSEDNSTVEEIPPIDNEIAAKFEVPGGDTPDLSNIEIFGNDGETLSLSEMTEDNWYSATCDGYVYLAEPLGIFYDNVDNSDIFNEDETTFKGVPEIVTHEYKKYKVGDMFGGMKLVEASTSFNVFNSDLYPAYFNGGSATFEGETVLTGKCRIAPEDDGYIAKRDIQFIPDANCKKLPLMNYNADKDGNESLLTYRFGDYVFSCEYRPIILLGNADSFPDIDFSQFPDDGSFVDVKVTINKFYIRNLLDFTCSSSAGLVSIEMV